MVSQRIAAANDGERERQGARSRQFNQGSHVILMMFGGIFTHNVHSTKLSKPVTATDGKRFVCHGIAAFAEDSVRYRKGFLLSSCFISLFFRNH